MVERLWRNHPLGELYRCKDLTTDTPVLLQRLRREFAEPGVGDRLFDTRGRAALGSLLIPDILDYGADFDGRPFVVTRTYRARTLAELERPIAFDEAVDIIEDIARALIPAHAERLVHGGIEPWSVLVDRGADGRPRVVALLGFGLVPALEAGADKCKNLPLLMSPTHVAPELVRGAPMSPAADVYALGILLWELIYGAPPFRGPTLRVLDAHTSRALPELELPFDVPPAFDWVLRRMLGKNPVDRFADASVVSDQLRPFLADGIPDLTSALDPSRPWSAAHARALDAPTEAANERPSGRLAAAEDEEEVTIIFDRRGPEPCASSSAAAMVVDEAPLSAPRRGSRAKWAALASIAAASLLIGVQALLNARIDSAAEQADGFASEPMVVSASPVRPDPELAQEPDERPEPGVVEPLAAKLDNEDFHVRKPVLLAGVEHECLGDHVRRTVKVGVRVATDGSVDSATVLGTAAETDLGRCVEQQAAKLEFPASERGGYYVYTLSLR